MHDDSATVRSEATSLSTPSSLKLPMPSRQVKLSFANLRLHQKSASTCTPVEFLQLKDRMIYTYEGIVTISVANSGFRKKVAAARASMPEDGESRLATSTQDLLDKYDKVALGCS